MPDRPEQAGDETRAEEHEDRDPVRRRREHDGAEQRQRGDDEHAAGELDARPRDLVRPPVTGEPGDEDAGEVDDEHVRRADGAGAEEARDEQRRPADRPRDERLQQAALGVAGDRRRA